MVLTEAFAAGTPVVASDIAGYRDVVRDGVDGVLVPRGDAQALAEALRDLYEEPVRRAEMARAAALGAERFAWPSVAAQVMEAYEDAIAIARAGRPALQRAAVRVGRSRGRSEAARSGPAPPQPGADAHRTAAPQQGVRGRAPRSALGDRLDRWRRARRASRSRRSGLTNIASALITASPTLVLLGLAVMCSAMVGPRRLVVRDPQGRAAPRRACGSPTPPRARSSAC